MNNLLKEVESIYWRKDNIQKLILAIDIPNKIQFPLNRQPLGKYNLTILPNEFDTTEIQWPNNKIMSIPPNIKFLHNLTTIDLSNNEIKEIPISIGNLPKLRSLDLSENQITVVPKEIGNLSNLQYLNLAKNRIEDLPYEIGNLSNLTSLLVSWNKLKSIPATVGRLSKLSQLRLNDNPDLKVLPNEIKQLKSLKGVTITGTKIDPNELTFLKT